MKPIAMQGVRLRFVTAALLSAFVWLGGFREAPAGVNVWTTTGPEGEEVLALALDPLTPATLYAGTRTNGVYRSTDAGGQWAPVNAGPASLEVHALAINPWSPSILYAGTLGGVFWSADGGDTWAAANTGLPDFFISDPTSCRYVAALAIDPWTPATLYATTRSCGMFKSTDGGSHWARLQNIDPIDFFFALVIDPRSPDTLYAGTEFRGVFKSTDGGASWSAANTLQEPCLWTRCLEGNAVAALAIDPQAPATLYASPGYKSTDGGATWRELGQPRMSFSALAIDPLTPSTLYAATGNGVVKSTDGGGSWSDLNAGLTVDPVHALVIDPQNPAIVHAATGAGVYSLQQQPGNGPPHADAGDDRVVEATGPDGALVTLDGAGSSDPDGDALTFAWS